MYTVAARPKSLAANGFTLVEVSIALGLISFALIAMIGVMQTGLSVLHDANQKTIDAQILQQVSSAMAVNTASNRPAFSVNIGTSASYTLYFDPDGDLLSTSTGARYSAVLQDQAPALPGVTASADISSLQTSLKWTKISITRIDIPNAQTNTYFVPIAYH